MIGVMLLPTLVKLSILIDFKINQDFISNVRCINRETPITLCKGKCYLSAQLKKVEEQKDRQTLSTSSQKTEIPCYLGKTGYDNLECKDTQQNKPKHRSPLYIYASLSVGGIFRPPQPNLVSLIA